MCQKKLEVTCTCNAPRPPSTKAIIARENNQRTHKICLLELTYKDILNRVLSILLQESNIAGLTETDLCKAQVSSEEYYRALKS